MGISFFNSLTFIIIFQVLLVILLLKQKKNNKSLSDKLLFLLIVLFGLQISFAYTQSTLTCRFFLPFHKFLYLIFLISFAVGPLFYFYIKSILTNQLIIGKRELIHFVPLILALLISAVLIAPEEKFIIWPSEIYKITLPILIIYTGIYLVFSCRTFFLMRKKTRKSGQLNWIKVILSGYILLWFYNLFTASMLQAFHKISWCQHTESIYFGSTFIIVNSFFIYITIKPVFHQLSYRMGKPVISDEMISEYAKLIMQCLEKEKMYLNPELSLNHLSLKFGINQKYLSEAINRCFNKSFVNLVNELRIEESKRLFTDRISKELSIKEICYQAGFNSRNAFNNAFKKCTGISPSEFRKKIPNSFTDS